MPKFDMTIGLSHILGAISVSISLGGIAWGAVSAWTEVRIGQERLQDAIVDLKEDTARRYDGIRDRQGDTAADISRLAARTRSIEQTVATRGGQFEALQEDVRDTNQLLRDIVMSRRSELLK